MYIITLYRTSVIILTPPPLLLTYIVLYPIKNYKLQYWTLTKVKQKNKNKNKTKKQQHTYTFKKTDKYYDYKDNAQTVLNTETEKCIKLTELSLTLLQS